MTEDSRPVVLVVEDDQNLADFYSQWLEEEYDVRTAYGGEEAIRRYDGDVDVVLLDRRMPNVSGDEVLEHISEGPHDPGVAMVTAVNPEFDIVEMEFDEYLTKPVSREELQEVVEELLALTAYDERVKEYYTLTAKRATLTANKPDDELEESDDYDSLMQRLADIQEELETLRDELDYEQLQNAFGIIDFEVPSPEEQITDESD